MMRGQYAITSLRLLLEKPVTLMVGNGFDITIDRGEVEAIDTKFKTMSPGLLDTELLHPR